MARTVEEYFLRQQDKYPASGMNLPFVLDALLKPFATSPDLPGE